MTSNSSSCLNYLHRLGFAFKRPKKRLLKADEAKRESFVTEYADMSDGARSSGAKIFFADEVLFQADAELQGKSVLKGEPTLVDSSNPHYGDGPSTTRLFAWGLGMWKEWNWNGTATREFRQRFSSS